MNARILKRSEYIYFIVLELFSSTSSTLLTKIMKQKIQKNINISIIRFARRLQIMVDTSLLNKKIQNSGMNAAFNWRPF